MGTDRLGLCAEPVVSRDGKVDWRGGWIWGGADASPRNAWRCFRKTFRPPANFDQADLAISADSRYVLFINGEQVGRGPPRSWPWEQAYDLHRVGHLLRADEDNTIAVLVMHYGVSTFNYVRGRAGLLAQLELREQGTVVATIATDGSWSTSPHRGHDPRAPRMSVQLGYAERIDAREWRDDWATAAFDDSGWAPAALIGPVGTEPWTRLVPSTIPHLGEEVIEPARIVSLHAVQPVSYTAVIDTCSQMMPESADHANAVTYVGYLATIIRAQRSGSFTIGSPLAGSSSFGDLYLNGRRCPPSAIPTNPPERYHQAELVAGDNLLLIDISGHDRGGVGLHLVIDSAVPFELCSPSDECADLLGSGVPGEGGMHQDSRLDTILDESSPFVTVGPFAEAVVIDHRPEPQLEYDHDEFALVSGAESSTHLLAFSAWLRRVPNSLCSHDDVFAACIRTRERSAHPVPAELQRGLLSSDDPGEVPLLDGADTEFVVDMGRETSGYLSFEVDAAEGTVIDFYGFEHLDEAPHGNPRATSQLPTDPVTAAPSDDSRRQDTFGLDNTLRYVCREGRQSYTSKVRRGLRYLMVVVRQAAGGSTSSAAVASPSVSARTRPAIFTRIVMNESTFPVEEIGQFRCSDRELERIWQISRRTLKLCMEDTYVDCPTYEQTFWVGDARNASIVNRYLFGAEALTERCLRLVPGSKRHTPFLADQVPSGWNSVIPNWTFLWVVACLEHYRHTGDQRFAGEMWPHVRSALQHYLERLDERGLFRFYGWNFLDWAPIDQPNDGVVAHQNMFLVRALRAGAALARHAASEQSDSEGAAGPRPSASFAERPEASDGAKFQGEASIFERRAARLAECINDHLWSAEHEAFRDCIHADGSPSRVFSMQTQLAAYLCRVAEGDRRGRLEEYLVSPPDDFVPIGSPFMSFFYYEALVELGRYDRMIEDIRTNYGRMLAHGATTCWEMYPGSENRANEEFLTRSHCHAWSAAPGYFLGAHLLGVRGTEPGWRRLIVAPQPCDLDWAEGSVPLPNGGRIDVSWNIGDSGISIEVAVTAGIDVEVQLPAGVASATPPRISVVQ